MKKITPSSCHMKLRNSNNWTITVKKTYTRKAQGIYIAPTQISLSSNRQVRTKEMAKNIRRQTCQFLSSERSTSPSRQSLPSTTIKKRSSF